MTKQEFENELGKLEFNFVVKGLIVGLMLGITEAHAIQPIAVFAGAMPWAPKTWVAMAGAILYAICTVGLYLGKRWALGIAIGGPLVGFTVVVGGAILGTAVQPDVWTWGGAVLQVPALLLAVFLLRVRRRGET